MKIGIVAPSSKVPQVELELGIRRIEEEGFDVVVHPQCHKSHLFFAGTDEQRGKGFFQFAQNPEIDVIWCARGGHGSLRLLSILDELSQKEGRPSKKLLVGYSDITILMEYVRKRWGWSTLHAPMPTLRKFSILGSKDWDAMTAWIQGFKSELPWAGRNGKLKFWTKPPLQVIQAPVVGGNLSVWTSLLGTPYEASAQGSLLFLEDVDEPFYRIDRMLCQLSLSRSLQGVRGILLGNFMNCRDYSPSVLKKKPQRKSGLENPKATELKPLRQVMKEGAALRKVFTEWGNRLGVPVATGLPVGHGPEVSPMPLGAEYRLSPSGELKLVDWDWTSGAKA